MIRFVASRSLRDWGVAVVVLFASLLLNPRASEATCGDYLHHSGPSAARTYSLPNQLTSNDANWDHVAVPSAPHRPCQGPGCSDHSLPSNEPTTVVVVSIDRWVLARIGTVPNVIDIDQLPAESFDQVADGFRLGILRPPR